MRLCPAARLLRARVPLVTLTASFSQVCALKFSESARARITKAGGSCITFDQVRPGYVAPLQSALRRQQDACAISTPAFPQRLRPLAATRYHAASATNLTCCSPRSSRSRRPRARTACSSGAVATRASPSATSARRARPTAAPVRSSVPRAATSIRPVAAVTAVVSRCKGLDSNERCGQGQHGYPGADLLLDVHLVAFSAWSEKALGKPRLMFSSRIEAFQALFSVLHARRMSVKGTPGVLSRDLIKKQKTK